MKSCIKLNSEVTIDIPKLIEGGMVILANSGGGKSYAIRKIAEESVDQVQTIILDPEGEFASLREKYDFILAGKNADVPVEVRSAALLAVKLLELGKSAVIDLYELHPQERQRYVKLFCDAMVNCPKELYHPVIVILDEAHEYVPEGKPSEATWAVESLASKGRKRGQRLILASQRISKLSKNASAECNNKLIGRASQDIDMKRAGDELGFNKEKLVQLRQLKPGEFFAFGPAISDDVMKVKVGEVKTEHAKVGYKNANKVPPPSHVIKKVLGELADLPKEAEKEAKTVSELKKENGELKRLNTNLLKHPFQKDLTKEEVRLIVAPYLSALQKIHKEEIEKWDKYASDVWMTCYNNLTSALRSLEVIKKHYPKKNVKDLAITKQTFRSTPIVIDPLKKKGEFEIKHVAVQTHNGELTGSEKKILNAIAWCESIGNNKPPQELVAFLSGYSHFRSTGYTNPRGYLRSKGLIDYSDGSIFLTEQGRALAETPETPLNQEELHRVVLQRLDGSEQKVLKPLLESYPEPMSNADLALALDTNTSEAPVTPIRAVACALLD